MSESSLRVIVLPSLVYPYFDTEPLNKMENAKPCWSSKKLNELNAFAVLSLFVY